MLYLCDISPNFCPKCGRKYQSNNDSGDQLRNSVRDKDFFAGQSFSCVCDANYQYTPRAVLLEASKPYGDLTKYQQ